MDLIWARNARDQFEVPTTHPRTGRPVYPKEADDEIICPGSFPGTPFPERYFRFRYGDSEEIDRLLDLKVRTLTQNRSDVRHLLVTLRNR